MQVKNMVSLHKIKLTKKELEKYSKQGMLRVESKLLAGNKKVKEYKAQLLSEMKAGKKNMIELTFTEH